MLDFIRLCDHDRAREGLQQMLEVFDAGALLDSAFVSIETALLVIEVAKRAPDKPEWFPYGQWATIQYMQGRVEAELNKIPSYFP